MANHLGFTASGRHLQEEDRLLLTSVGIDIGSSTSHLVFSQIELERRDSRYAVIGRKVLHQSPVALTPYRDASHIDADRLGAIIAEGYRGAGCSAMTCRPVRSS